MEKVSMTLSATPPQTIQKERYFTKFLKAATTTFEGMAVTFANLLRPPVTIQYPDRLPGNQPFWATLPERTRGFLEVDLDICTACKLCEKFCPIDCIQILLEKRELDGAPKPVRGMSAFDIDMGKCMYCGLCVEPCPTGSIRMTQHFEGADQTLDSMVFRFVPFGGFAVPFKAGKKQREFATRTHGEIAQETLALMRVENRVLFDHIRKRKAEDDVAKAKAKAEADAAAAAEAALQPEESPVEA